MSQKDKLTKAFEKAGLNVVVTTKPINAVGNDAIFQMDIQRKIRSNVRSEYFRIFRGDEANTVQVRDIDTEKKQLILMVKEEPREFLHKEHMTARDLEKYAKIAEEEKTTIAKAYWGLRQGRIHSFTRTKHGATIEIANKTPGNVRYFLCGVDERQLFIAQVAKHITTVAEAHQELRGAAVTLAEGKVPGRTVRQGEWFFLHPTPDQERLLNAALRKKQVFIQKKVSINSAVQQRMSGKPHMAEELVRIAGIPQQNGFTVLDRTEVYVRGKITHPDHRTVKFATWRRVLKNAEAESGQRGNNGVYWVD